MVMPAASYSDRNGLALGFPQLFLVTMDSDHRSGNGVRECLPLPPGLMPIFAVDILKVGADGQGWLMAIGGVASLMTSIWFAAKGGNASKTLLIIGGGIMSGVSVAAFGLTSVWVGSFALALVLMFVMGVFNTMQNTALQASMQILVPDHIRGRVMGLYGMTYNIRPLGGMQAGALAGLVTAPFAIAIGGLAVAVFAAGAALTNRDLPRSGRPLVPGDREVDGGAEFLGGEVWSTRPPRWRRQPVQSVSLPGPSRQLL